METLQTMMDAFGELGGTLIAVIFMLVALLLAGLIVRASRSTAKSAAVQTPKAGSRYHGVTTAQQPAIASVAQPGADSVPAAAAIIEPQPVSEPVSQFSQASAVTIAADSDPQVDTEREAQNAALANPYPTDSVLRRHYETLHNLEPVPTRTKPEVEASTTPKESRSRSSIIELAVNKDEQAASAAVVKLAVNTAAKPFVPEDSVLKRHFIHQLQAVITAEMGPKPTDSVLKRHYDAAVRLVLEKRL